MPNRPLQYVTPGLAGATLGQRTVSGFFWLSAQSLGAKLLSTVGQIVLAWLLSPEHFGLVGLAYTVTAFANLIQQAGLREILIHRHAHFGRWATPAFWMSLTLGCVGAASMTVAAPFAAWLYEEPYLVGLVLVLAAAVPFSGLETVADARLTSEMRFRYLAFVKWTSAVITTVLSILFAIWGFGAYSFVLPQPVVAVTRFALLWAAARPPIRRTLHFRRWKYLIGDSALLFLAQFFTMITWQGDYIVLGIMHDAKTVGIYFFAFNLSLQTMQVFTSNLSGVLFPALSRLQEDPPRQTRAFLEAARSLALIGVPLCLLQAALAGPGMSLVFSSFWYPAIRVLQLLSIGMAVRLVASPAGSLLQAQGRFGAHLIVNAINAIVFLGMVTFGSSLAVGLKASVTVAAAVMLYFIFVGPIFLYVAIRPGGGGWRDILRVYAAPVLVGALAIGIAAIAGRLVPVLHNANVRNAIRVAVILLVGIGLYVPMIRRFSPASFAALVERLRSLRGGLVHSRGAARTPASTVD